MLWILDASINVSMKPFRALFGGHSINALALGGLLLVLAGLATLRVDDYEDRD